jgi:RHS repeat-associated protein
MILRILAFTGLGVVPIILIRREFMGVVMFRRVVALLVAWLLLTGVVEVGAAPPGVAPQPDDEALVTDTSSWPRPSDGFTGGVASSPELLPLAESRGPSTAAARTVADGLSAEGRAVDVPVVVDGEFRVELAAGAPLTRVVEAAPLMVGPTPAGSRLPSPGVLLVDVIGSEVAGEIGLIGFGFQLSAADDGTAAMVSLDYSAFRDAAGGDFAGRLQLVRYPECVLTDPKDAKCARGEVVADVVNDSQRSVIEAIVDVDGRFGSISTDEPASPNLDVAVPEAAGPSSSVPSSSVPSSSVPSSSEGSVPAPQVATAPSLSTSSTPGVDGAATVSEVMPTPGFGRRYRASGSGGSVYGLSSGFSSNFGSFTATPLSNASSWSVGLSMGSFDWSYPVPVPPTGYGSAPSVSMSYSSSSVDGVVSDENTQGGTLGAGWSLNAGGFIERTYKSCTEDGGSINDFCWYSDNATISLNGRSTEMYFTGVGNLNTWSEWRLKDDPGWKVVRHRGAASGPWDNLGEIWYVSSPDGTEYTFGQRFVTGTNEELQSVWPMPVFGNHVGEPCYPSSCQQAWRWNLDRVRDRSGNVTLYKYAAELNQYGAGGNAYSPQVYVRGGYLAEIRYGIREGDEGFVRNKVTFNMKERCLSNGPGNCEWSSTSSTPWYVDSPTDLRCTAAPCWKTAPGFWTEKALDSIDTWAYSPDQLGSLNLISNSSFEGSSTGWGAIAPPGGGITNKAAYNNAARAKDGTWFMQANTSAAGGSVYTDIAVAPTSGVPHTFTMWVRSSTGTPVSGQLVLWGLWNTPQNAGKAFTATSEWLPVSVTFTGNVAANTSMRAQVYINTPGVNLDFDFASVMPPWQLVDRIKPTLDWPDIDGWGGQPPQLWLRTIGRTGKPNGPAPITVPDIRFESSSAPDNRADAVTMQLWRVTEINDELGGRTTATYTQATACTAQPPGAGWHTNTQDCYPRWTTLNGAVGWGTFNRFLVQSVTRTDLVAGATAVTTTYTYEGSPGYRHDDSEFTAHKTWSQPRGYPSVVESTGPGLSGTYTKVRHRFFQGMHGDNNGTGGTRTVVITYPDGSTQADDDWLAGIEYSTELLDNSTVIERDERFFTTTAQSWGGLTWRRVDQTRVRHSSRESGGAYLYTEVRTAYDSYGMPTEVWDRGNVSATSDDTCTSIQYVRNTTATNVWLVDLVARTVRAAGTNGFAGGYAGNCDESAGAELSFVDQYYDNLTHLNAQVTGNLTRVSARPSATAGWITTNYTVDGAGHVTAIDGPMANDTAAFFFNSDGFNWSQRDATGHTTSQDIDPGRGTTRTTTDSNDGLSLSPPTNGADKITVTDHDALGRLVAVQFPGDPNPTIRYDYSVTKTAPSRTRSYVQQTDNSWRNQYVYYDGLGRQREVRADGPNGGSLVAAWDYDGRSNPVKQYSNQYSAGAPLQSTIASYSSAAASMETRTTYDNLNRVTETARYSAGNPVTQNGVAVRTVISYDGHWANTFPPTYYASPSVGAPTSTHTNALGQVDQTVDYNSNASWSGPAITTYSYNLNGQLTSTTDPKGNPTTATYDNLGRQLTSVDRDRGQISTVYNANGTVATVTDTATNVTLTYSSDVLGRPLEVRHGTTLLEKYTYDAAGEAGLLDSASSFYNGAELRVDVNGYDSRSRPTGYSYTIPAIAGFTDTNGLAGTYNFNTFKYRRDDQLSQMSYPTFGALAAEQVNVGYNSVGAPTTLTGTIGALVGATSFTNEGRVATRTYGATTDTLKITRSYGWNLATGQLTTLTATQNGVNLQADTHSYDANGNLTSNVHNPNGTSDDHTECYQYDGRNRLRRAFTTGAVTVPAACATASAGGPGVYDNTYSIDEIGNFITGPAGTYTYPASGATSTRPHAPTTAGANTFAWNPDGTMATKTNGGVTSAYGWDQFDRLRSVTKGADVTTMIYYPGGQRALMKDTAGVHLYFDGYGERHANNGGASAPTAVASKTWDSSVEGMSSWYNATLTSDTVTKRTGAGSLKVTSSSPWFGIVDFGAPQAVTAGDNYTFSVYARADTTPANVNLVVRWLNSSWDQLGYTYAVPSGNDTTTGWTEFTTSMIAPPDAAMVRFGVQINGSNSGEVHWFDDYTLTSSTVTTANVAAKGFETTTDNMTTATAATVAASTAQAHTGTRSLAVTPTGAWTVTDTSAGIAVTPANTYRVTGWAKIAAGSGTIGVTIDWYNTSNSWLRSDDIVQHENLAVWASFTTHNMTPPAGAAYAKTRLTGDNGAVWYIDDLTLGTVSNPPATTLTERRYYQLGGVSIGSRSRDTVTNIDQYHYYLGDTRGSTSLAVQRGTTTVETQWYDPYGKPRGTTTITATDRGYIGQYEDATTGLNYLNNRYHDPTTGVFLSVDPLVAITDEPYLYGSGNPTTLSDPTGLEAGCGWSAKGNSCSWKDSGGRSPCPRNDAGALTCAPGYQNPDGTFIDDNPRWNAYVKTIYRQPTGGSLRTTLRFMGNVLSFIPLVDIPADGGLCADSALNGTVGEAGFDCGSAAIPLIGTGWTRLGRRMSNLLGFGGRATNTATGWLDEAATANVPSGWGPGAATKKGVGTRWTDPANPGNGIRIDQGNPLNSQVTQQVDHVVVRYNGQVIGRNGQPISGSIAQNAEQAHIPLTEWQTWNTWFAP